MQSEKITFIDQTWKGSKNIAIILSGSIFLAIASQIAIYLPGISVPITMQTLAIFLLGGTLGSKKAASSVLAYLAQGSLGLPVFAGGLAQPLWFCDPKAGFLLSFVAAAFLIGKIVEQKSTTSFLTLLFALFLAQIVIFILGASWLSFFVGTQKAYLFGVVPFLFGALCKIISGSCLLKAYQQWRNR